MNVTLQEKLEAGFNNFATTENGAIARKTTDSAVLDLFSQINAYRVGNVINQRSGQLRNAWNENAQLTLRTLFYSRDVRGGQGEREVFRTFIKELAVLYPDKIATCVALVPNYGRWDDLYAFVGTPLEAQAFEVIKAQWLKDINTDKPSIMGKWLKSVNTSSKDSVNLGIRTAKALGLHVSMYRKALSKLRTNINVVEKLISAGQWQDVNYSHVPSQANLKYGKAFMVHDAERRSAFYAALERGDTEVKINATTQFPYEIVSKVFRNNTEGQLADAMWKAQPDYFNGVQENSLVVADVSDSMTWNDNALAMRVCLSLAIYAAERNTGVWKDKFITFSTNPEMQTIVGNNLYEKVNNLSHAHWNGSTDIEAVFNRILNVAVRDGVAPSEMVKRLYIVSDMEFDAATRVSYGSNVGKTLFETLREKYQAKGYELPELVFWNVSARNTQFPMSIDDRGFINVSGCSPSIFKSVVGKQFVGPYEMMLEVLNSPRYEAITVV